MRKVHCSNRNNPEPVPTIIQRLGLADHPPQSSSASRFTAGAFGFLLLIQSRERPDRYGESRRFETIPSSRSGRRHKGRRCRHAANRAFARSWRCRRRRRSCCLRVRESLTRRVSQGFAALRDFHPAYDCLGQKREAALFGLMSAFAGCGHACQQTELRRTWCRRCVGPDNG